MFNKILIANRGEIACRIIRSCQQMGVATVAVYSEADNNALHASMADEAVCIGPAAASESYLKIDAILDAARNTGAEAIHPGYGFLSENTDFARAVGEAGIVFIGPSPETIDQMGSKADAKRVMEAAGVPTVPGYHDEDQDDQRLEQEAARVGFPLMIKAAAGGGGKGMRIVQQPGDFKDALASARRESQKAFGDEVMILERYIQSPRHIEFQVFGDQQGNVIHLFERDCSTQRRYQKVIEEAPSPLMTAELRETMGAAAVAAAKAVNYTGAGTIEFILPGDQEGENEFFFMEMNTRLQVEHPVTEMITGVDLVEWQLRVAAGEPLPQQDLQISGHAIEVRIYAEDPDNGFLPSSGPLKRLSFPKANSQVRIDTGVRQGDTVSVHYDPMIAKLIVHGDNRVNAVNLLSQSLQQCSLFGITSNIGFLQHLSHHPRFLNGSMHTAFLDNNPDQVTTEHNQIAQLAAVIAILQAQEQQAVAQATDPWSPWGESDGWRLTEPEKRDVHLQGQERLFFAYGSGSEYEIHQGDDQWRIRQVTLEGNELSFRQGGRSHHYVIYRFGDELQVSALTHRSNTRQMPGFQLSGDQASSSKDIKAPMPGQIVAINIKAGDSVEADQIIVIMEAMKMELSLPAAIDGKIKAVKVAAGDFVEADSLLVELEDA